MSGPPKCYNCGKVGHIAKNCYQFVSAESSSSSSSGKVLPPYIDTHCHVEYILQKARKPSFFEFQAYNKFPANYGGCISIFCDPAALSPSFSTWVEQLSDPQIWGAFGIHPHNAKYYNDSLEQRIIECLQHPKAIAWGECGLDFFKNNSPKDVQIAAFTRQVIRAVELKKPLVVHSRDAEQDTINILKANLPATHPVHIHCFNDSEGYAITLMADFPNLFIGITGQITFAGCGRLRDMVRDIIPLDRILLETDAPYMTPSKLDESGASGSKHGKGKKGGGKDTINHPGFIPMIAETIASLKGITMEEVYAQVRINTNKCYGI
eukprot:TRINITY_DN3037_c0_g1_i3.p1 TRINITY_DN3037_c0_g1~~TRINITY_DN3037_c0_g1_i3.p1  ORF type:complete len:322 (+),score=39.84 TRINITY_DN3037_c0_g1_i3:473-1438(+)